MKPKRTTNVVLVGLGGQGRVITKQYLIKSPKTKVLVACDPSFQAYAEFAEIYLAAGLEPPPYEQELQTALHKYGGELDVAIICSPTARHFDQSMLCLKKDLHVLSEKQMTKTVAEARKLVDICESTGLIFSVGFQGLFTAEMQEARNIIGSGELGQVQTIHGDVWQNWFQKHSNEWRMDPAIAGGGFFYDTTSHAMSSILHLAGEDFVSISAEFDRKGTSVEVNAAVRGRLRSQALVQILATGDTAPSCGSDIRVYCSDGILRTTAWGDSLQILRRQPKDWKLTGSSWEEGWETVEIRKNWGMWEQFLSVIEGVIPNPSDPRHGLRMALIWEAVKCSADNGGGQVLL